MKNPTKRFVVIAVSLLLVGIWLVALSLPAAASPGSVVIYNTPTPRPDGRIIYIVKQNDTCISIALLHKITEAQLRNLNNIRGEKCIIQLGQEILIGYAGPAESPTPGPSMTPTALLPTPTPLPGKVTVCVVLYKDTNGNGQLEGNENLLAGGEVSIANPKEGYSKTGTTVDTPDKPLCFQDVIEGEYTISMAIPQGYNPTTLTSRTIQLQAGDTSTLDFGAQESLKAPPPTKPPEGDTRLPLFGVLGILLILAGIGLAVYLRRLMKS